MRTTAAGLDNPQTVQQLESPRAYRYRLRQFSKRYSKRERLRDCGEVLGQAVAVQRLATGEGAFGGVESCASVWSCPVCSARIAAQRREELMKLVGWANLQGYTIHLLTLTQAHNAGDSLKGLWDSLSAAWSRVSNCVRWKRLRDAYGIAGYVRAVEVTHGAAGWHVHTHLLVLSAKSLGEKVFIWDGRKRRDEETSFRSHVAEKWGASVRKSGYDFDPLVGMDLQEVQGDTAEVVASYVGKCGDVGSEMVAGAFKRGRSSSRTPFQILHDIGEKQDPRDVVLWRIWEEASTGRRQLNWSRGLKEACGLLDVDDEVLFQQQSERETLGFISRKDWRSVLHSQLAAIILDRLGTEAHADNVQSFNLVNLLCVVYGVKLYQRIEEVPRCSPTARQRLS